MDRFPHFCSADGGMVATEMAERLDEIDPEYFRRKPHDQARVLLEALAHKEDEVAALTATVAERDAQIAALREALARVKEIDWNQRPVGGAIDAMDDIIASALAAVPAPPTPAPLAAAERDVIAAAVAYKAAHDFWVEHGEPMPDGGMAAREDRLFAAVDALIGVIPTDIPKIPRGKNE